jgi:hypothetical protein
MGRHSKHRFEFHQERGIPRFIKHFDLHSIGKPHEESWCSAGRIEVTDKVRVALCNDYRFAGPSTVDVKGKRPTRVWFLEKAA